MSSVDPQSRVVVQARMSSARFPGKVLAPLRGRPVIAWVVERLSGAVGRQQIVVATSEHPSDDPVAAFVRQLGIDLFRGPLENVVQRVQLCLRQFPCPWFFRISADSPLMDPAVVSMVSERLSDELDLVTNVFPRSFPRGHSVELIRSDTFLGLESEGMTPEQREHVTQVYYDAPSRFRIRNVDSGDASRANLNYGVDTPEDLRRLEREMESGAAL